MFHHRYVKLLNDEIGSLILIRSPFDIIFQPGKTLTFYEVKCAAEMNGRHRSECRITFSDDEIKFGALVGNALRVIIFFKNKRYDIPFDKLLERINKVKTRYHEFGGSVVGHRRICLTLKFLTPYEVFNRWMNAVLAP